MPEDQLPPEADTEQLSELQLQQQERAAAAEEEHHQHNGALLDRLRNQVAFYFSLQNLARDKYLRNMLTTEHPEMPSHRPAQLMCPVGVVTNFPKVRDICAQFGGGQGQPPEPPALLLAKALDGSNLVTISSDGNWIGPVLQQLPPPTMGGAPPAAMGGLPPPVHHFQQQPHHFQPQAPHMSFQQGSYPQPQPNHMPMMVPPGAAAMQYQPAGMPLPYGAQYPNNAPVNAAPIISLGGSESPSSASLESSPSQQQHQTNVNGDVYVTVLDLPPGPINPIEILSAFATETIRPKSAFLDHLNTNLWFVSFASEVDAKTAIVASAERTIAGIPVHAKLNSELPASSTASLSSMSAPGQMGQPQPVPLMGGVGYPLLPQGPSPPPHGMGTPPPPMATTQSNAAYPPQYGMPPPQIQPPPQLAGMPPPGQPYTPHQPYYNPQQQMQQVYPGYMQPHQQQGGPPQPQQQMMQPYPPPPQMGNRFGVVPPPPPPPRSGYPGGPPPPYPYQGMHQQYVDGYGGPHYQQYGHPHPPPRHYNDRRQGGPGGAGTAAGGGGGGGGGGGFHEHQGQSRTGKKKKKNQQQHQRDSYGNSSNDNNNGFRRNNEYNNYGQQIRNDDSTSPIPSHQGGGQKSSWKHKRGENDHQFRRSHGNAPPSFHRNFNKNHHNNDRTSGSDTAPSAGSSSNKQTKKTDEKEIFSSSDFPGLGGLGGDDKSDNSTPQGSSKSSNNCDESNQQLVGYASALLKKEEVENEKKQADIAAPTVAETMDNQGVDSITRQTEEMEREILSEFHDLSLIGDGPVTSDAAMPLSPSPAKANNRQGPQTDDKAQGTASLSTMDASARSNPNTNNLPILPVGPFPENEAVGGAVSKTAHSSEGLQMQQQPQPPVIDVMNSQDFPSREMTNIINDGAVVPPAEEQTPPTVVLNSDTMTHAVDRLQPPGVWGSKRFADVI